MILVRNRIANIAILTSLVTALILTPGLAPTSNPKHAVAPSQATLSLQPQTTTRLSTVDPSEQSADGSSDDNTGTAAATVSGSVTTSDTGLSTSGSSTSTVAQSQSTALTSTDGTTEPTQPATTPTSNPVSSAGPVTSCGVCGTPYRQAGIASHTMCPMYCSE